MFLNRNLKCINVQKVNNLIDKISDLIDLEQIPNNIIAILRHLNSDYLEIFKDQVDKVKNISSKLFSNILLLQNRKLNDYIINSKIDNITIIPYHIELLCSNPGITVNELNSKRMSFNQTIHSQCNENYIKKLSIQSPSSISKTAILYAILGNHKLELIDFLIKENKDLILDSDYLIASCYSKKVDLIEYFLNNKIEVNHLCLKALYSNSLTNDILKINDSFMNYFNLQYKKNIDIVTSLNIIKIFQKYNYIFTYDDACFLIKHHVEIPSFEKYNINIDDAFINLCELNNFYPNYGEDKITKIKGLKLFDSNMYVTELKTEISKINYKPDQECLYKACARQNNTSVIKYLISLGLQIDEKCIEISKKILHKNSSLLLVLDEYMKNAKKPDVNVELEDKIKKMESRIKELEHELKVKNNKPKIENNVKISYLDKKIKLTQKQEVKVSGEFAQFFYIKTDFINLLTFKKVLLNYFKEKNLIKKDSFDIILESDLIKLIKFEKYGNQIDLKDLDDFCKFILTSFISSPN